MAFPVATVLALQYSHVLHGALVYTPGLRVELVLGTAPTRERRAECVTLHAAGVYATALVFCTTDQEVCPVQPIGTHFLWHSLIGLATYLAMRGLLLTLATRERSVASWREKRHPSCSASNGPRSEQITSMGGRQLPPGVGSLALARRKLKLDQAMQSSPGERRPRWN